MTRIYILTTIVIAVSSMAIWKPTNAFFMDAAVSGSNVFAAASSFPSSIPSDSPTPTLPDNENPTATPTPTTPSVTITTEPLPGKIVINEVSPLGDNTVEWIELYNSGGIAVDISGWSVEDGTSADTIPPTSPIQPNSYAVIITNNSTVTGIPGSAITITLGSATIGSELNNPGDIVRLLDSSSSLMDEMGYGSNTVYPTGLTTPFAGNTVSRIPNGVDTDVVGNWSSTTLPTIGGAN